MYYFSRITLKSIETCHLSFHLIILYYLINWCVLIFSNHYKRKKNIYPFNYSYCKVIKDILILKNNLKKDL